MMKTSIVLLIILELIFSSNAFARNMPRGSFLNKPVQNAKQLVSQLQKDKIVARRYKQQFDSPESKIVGYFKGNLQASTLKKAGKYNVYYHSSNKITMRVEHLSKGTRVFVDLQGKPVLKMRCGNPLVRELPQVSKPLAKPPVKKVVKNISKPVVPTPAIEVPPIAAVQTVEVVEAEVPPLIPPGVTEIIPIEETLPSPLPIQEIPVAVIPAVTDSTSSEWFLAPIGIGFALFLSDKGGGRKEQPSMVLEPSSMIALSTGICSMIVIYRRRK